MLIFGSSTKMLQLAMLNLLCGFCGNPSAHSLRKRVTKFTLFFIPLFPVAPARHFLQCTFCGGASEISKENADQLLAQAGGAPQQGGQQPGVPGPGGQAPYQGQPMPQAQGPQPGQPGPGQQQAYGQTPPAGNPFGGGQAYGGQPPQNPYRA